MGTKATGFEFELVLTAGCADTGGTVSPDARFLRPHARHARYAPPKCPSRVRIASAHPTRYRGARADLWKVVFCCVLTHGHRWNDPDFIPLGRSRFCHPGREIIAIKTQQNTTFHTLARAPL